MATRCARRVAARFALQPGIPVEVLPDGTVQQAGQAVGQLELSSFDRSAAWISSALNYFAPVEGVKPKPATGAVVQGKLEQSNVGAAESSVRLVAIMRQFEMLQKAMNIGNELNRQAIEEVARSHLLKNNCIDSQEEPLTMIRALYSAASGMTAQQLNIDNIANNLANANTVGYKSRRAQFQDLMYQTLVQPGTQSGARPTFRPGCSLDSARARRRTKSFSQQGDFSSTSNPLDMVIQGNGFFQIKQPNGDTAYTRAGQFQLDSHRAIVDANGNPLQPQITIPAAAQSINIATDGTVSYTLPNQTAAQTAGQISLANFQNPAGLNSIGQSFYLPTDASGAALVGPPGGTDGIGTILQGYVEQSNVSVVDEFINLISAQRAYEANSKVVKAADDMYSQVNNLTR